MKSVFSALVVAGVYARSRTQPPPASGPTTCSRRLLPESRQVAIEPTEVASEWRYSALEGTGRWEIFAGSVFMLATHGDEPGRPSVMRLPSNRVAHLPGSSSGPKRIDRMDRTRRPLEAASLSSSCGMVSRFAAVLLRMQSVRSPVPPQFARAACSALPADVDADVCPWADGLHS